MARDRAALGAFLRSRRDGLTLSQVGLPAGAGPRRVPGLRREEVAVLAGVSADYLRRLEQGRQPAVSVPVLDALARALRLDAVEQAHLHDLAAPAAPAPGERPGAPQRPEPGLLRVMAEMDHVPALLLGHRGEVLASNALVRAVLGRPLPPGASFVRYLLQDPLARTRILNWADFAAMAVAGLRREAGRRPYDPLLSGLIAELRAADADVACWWEDHAVQDRASMRKRVRHPVAGDLTFEIEPIGFPWDPDQSLVVYTVEPGSATAAALGLLGSWDAEASRSRATGPFLTRVRPGKVDRDPERP